MSLHSKAVPAEGRKVEGPAALAATCIAFDAATGEGELHLAMDTPLVEGRTLAFTRAQLWNHAMQSNQTQRRVTGDSVAIAIGTRCIAMLASSTGKLEAVQVLVRLTGKISSRPSAQVGQIEPDEQCKESAGANVFVRLSQVVSSDALQLPGVCERVEFHLAPNPERADRLWAAEVVPLEETSLSKQPISRSAISAEAPAESSSMPQTPKNARSFTPGCRVYIGRLPPEAGWRELQELFANFGELVHVQLPLDDSGRRRGYAIVELEKPEAAAAAVEK